VLAFLYSSKNYPSPSGVQYLATHGCTHRRQRSGSGGSGGSILTRTKLQLLSVRRRLHWGKIAAPLKIQLKNSSVQN